MSDSNYLIGTGIHDITGPAAEVGMMGYSMPYQKTEGIHMRLRSRSFVVASKDRSKCVAIVSADLGQLFHAVKQEAIKKLQADTNLRDENDNPVFHHSNVLISVTHTHSGPGGYSNYALYNLSMVGFDEDNFGFILRYGRYAAEGRRSDFVVGGLGLAELSKRITKWLEAQGPMDHQVQVVDEGSGELTIYLLAPEDS